MAELVDALVSGTSAARRGGSSPLLGTIFHQKNSARPLIPWPSPLQVIQGRGTRCGGRGYLSCSTPHVVAYLALSRRSIPEPLRVITGRREVNVAVLGCAATPAPAVELSALQGGGHHPQPTANSSLPDRRPTAINDNGAGEASGVAFDSGGLCPSANGWRGGWCHHLPEGGTSNLSNMLIVASRSPNTPRTTDGSKMCDCCPRSNNNCMRTFSGFSKRTFRDRFIDIFAEKRGPVFSGQFDTNR
jgi:hypothetical protein